MGIGIFAFAVSANFLDRFFAFCTKKLWFFGFGDYYGLWFLFYFTFGSRFLAKIKSSFRFAIRCGLVLFRFLFEKCAPQLPQPRAPLLWFCLQFSVLIKIHFGLAVFYYSLYAFAVSYILQCLPLRVIRVIQDIFANLYFWFKLFKNLITS